MDREGLEVLCFAVLAGLRAGESWKIHWLYYIQFISNILKRVTSGSNDKADGIAKLDFWWITIMDWERIIEEIINYLSGCLLNISIQIACASNINWSWFWKMSIINDQFINFCTISVSNEATIKPKSIRETSNDGGTITRHISGSFCIAIVSG